MPTDKYCTAEFVKKVSGIIGTDDDLFMGPLILAASRFVDNYTNVYWGPSATFTAEKVTAQRIMGRWDDVIYTRYAPIISVSSLADNVRTYTETTQFEVFNEDGYIQLVNDFTADQATWKFSKTPGKLLITYIAGQGAAKTGEYVKGIAAPEDVQLGTAIVAAWFHESNDRMGIVSRQRDGDGQVFDDQEIPRTARLLLNNRRRFAG